VEFAWDFSGSIDADRAFVAWPGTADRPPRTRARNRRERRSDEGRRESNMVRVESIEGQGSAVALPPSAMPGHVDAGCFGERDMHRRQAGTAHPPLAAGLFGIASGTVPTLVRGRTGRA
jgi:hypothetical protein